MMDQMDAGRRVEPSRPAEEPQDLRNPYLALEELYAKLFRFSDRKGYETGARTWARYNRQSQSLFMMTHLMVLANTFMAQNHVYFDKLAKGQQEALDYFDGFTTQFGQMLGELGALNQRLERLIALLEPQLQKYGERVVDARGPGSRPVFDPAPAGPMPIPGMPASVPLPDAISMPSGPSLPAMPAPGVGMPDAPPSVQSTPVGTGVTNPSAIGQMPPGGTPRTQRANAAPRARRSSSRTGTDKKGGASDAAA